MAAIATAESATDPRWDELVRYHWACTHRASVADPAPVNVPEWWTVLPLDAERVIVGAEDNVWVGPWLRELFDAVTGDEAVFYGWPLVIVEDRQRVLRVAPLVVTELEPPSSGCTRRCSRRASRSSSSR